MAALFVQPKPGRPTITPIALHHYQGRNSARNVSPDPWRIGDIAAAALTILHIEHDPNPP